MSGSVRHAASFGEWTKNEPKLAACLTICRGRGTDPNFVGRLATSFGDQGFRHGIWVKSGSWDSPGNPCQTRSEFWDKTRDFVWDSLRVWQKIPGRGLVLDRDTPVALAALPRRRPRGHRLRGLGRATGEAFATYGRSPSVGWNARALGFQPRGLAAAAPTGRPV